MKNVHLFCFALMLTLTACMGEQEAEQTPEEIIPEVITEVPADTIDTIALPVGVAYYDHIARYISGLTLDSADEAFEAFIDNDSWRDYAMQIDKSWNRFTERKLTAIGPWVKENITDKSLYTKTAFYPFSGPDFTYLNAFLPEADNYYLFGLEPVGKIPNINELEVDSVDQLFIAMNDAIRDNINLSFFITKKMKEEINNDQVTGTIPVLLFFMSRSGKKILDIEPKEINDAGELITIESEDPLNKEFKKIVEISYTEPGATQVKKLYYFSMNIGDSGFYRRSRMVKFFDNLPEDLTTFVKSASYCMHDDQYSKIRNVILTKSKFVIEDDSGIPFRYFPEDQWEHKFYGSYTAPIEAFSMQMQEDYLEAFKQAEPLPFRFGYNYPSNLFIAIRK